ncbi:MAG: hypothetical protein ACO4CU_07275 [Ilumatobacteraceae bacterium]
MARTLGWRTAVVDPRGKFATAERIPSADAIEAVWPDAAYPALALEAADHVGAGLAERRGQLVDALAGVEREGQEARHTLAAHRREVGDVAEGERCLADEKQAVGPGADDDQVGLVDRLVFGAADLRQAGDRPRLLLQFGTDQFGCIPGVAGEALDEQCCLHHLRFNHVRNELRKPCHR